ncbi:NAD(P)H-dependent oxidoreductase [Agrococcus versicolor]|uniref:NAD(P)H-dependent oxidoreductase n=1 Tax=Agrococcus versicolor TaxID=501482 RepID=UPI0031E1F6D3
MTRTLVVVAHPDPASRTMRVAERLRDRLGGATIADLAAEGFDPRFGVADLADYRAQTRTDDAVLAEQARVDAHDHLVLVFPAHWWSMPALLKGWIDRVLVGGWAFALAHDGSIVRMLDRLTVHAIPVAGTDAALWERHGYAAALETQLMHGVVDYCGARRGAVVILHDSERPDDAALAADLESTVAAVAAAIRMTPTR